jgi:hypothetical protein
LCAISLTLAVCLAGYLAGCAKNIDTPEAVKAGVIKDIGKKVDVESMSVNVDSVSFREKEADAKVSFWPKGGDRAQSITMTYTLERQGDEWKIKNRNMEMGHTGQPGAPPAGGLPAGHPPMPPGAATSGQLPAGHPQVDPNQKP